MWVEYKSCELEELVGQRSGKPYTAFAFRGTKKGYQGAPDEDYVRPFFENTLVAIKEKGVWRYGIPAAQYIQKACTPGDLIELKFDRSTTPPELVSIENKSTNMPTYEPLTDEQAAEMALHQQTQAPAAPMQPQTQAMPQQPAMPVGGYPSSQAPAPGYAQQMPAQNAGTAPVPAGYNAATEPMPWDGVTA